MNGELGILICEYILFPPLQLNPRRISHHQIKPAPALKHIRKLQLPVEELLLLRHLIGDAQARETRPELIEVHCAVFAVAVGELPGIRVKIKIIEHGDLIGVFLIAPCTNHIKTQ